MSLSQLKIHYDCGKDTLHKTKTIKKINEDLVFAMSCLMPKITVYKSISVQIIFNPIDL